MNKPRKVWKCDQCGREDVWGDGWRWFPEERHGSARQYHDPEPAFVVCSSECRLASPYRDAPLLDY